MPQFYFHLYNDMNVADHEGENLPDLAAAKAYAIVQARALAGATVKEEGRIALNHRIDIEDERQAVLATVSFRDVIAVED